MKIKLLFGPRVHLRPLERGDLLRYQELLSKPDISIPYGELGIPSSLTKLERWYDSGGADMTDRYLLLGIETEDILIGIVSLNNDENIPSRTASFGILIGDNDYLNQGYGTEASRITLDYAFAILGYHKINLDVFEYNKAALTVYEKLGFVFEGRRRENHWSRGRFWDELLLGITAEEWWEKHDSLIDLETENTPKRHYRSGT